MSITYEEALSTLSAMFSSPWTTESLDWVLRHFEGHMENTVDAILTHGDGDPQVLISRLETGQDSTALDEQLARSLAAQQEQQQQQVQSSPSRSVSTRSNQSSVTELSAVGNAGISNATRPASSTSSSRSNSTKQRGTPTTLPDDFLRIPGAPYASAAAAATTSTDANTLATDEALARMLQDKLFAQELKNNPEFAHLARGGVGAPSADHVQWGFGNRSNQQQARDGPGVMEALAGMGEGAKRRLAELAQKVKTNVDRINQQNSERGGGGDGFVPASERRGLLDLNADDDHDSEEISFARQDTDYEMRHMAFSSASKKSN